MKGDEAEYVIPFAKVFNAPKGKRTLRAVTAIKRFVGKHTRIENVSLTDDVNHFIHKNSKNIPRRIEVVLRKTGGKGEEKITVYLKGSKQIGEDKKKEAEKKEKKKAAEKKEEKAGAKALTEEEKRKEEEEKKKLEEKKEREKAARALEVKGKD